MKNAETPKLFMDASVEMKMFLSRKFIAPLICIQAPWLQVELRGLSVAGNYDESYSVVIGVGESNIVQFRKQ